MSIFLTSYDTHACYGAKIKSDISLFQKARYAGAFAQFHVELNDHDDPFTLHLIQGGNPEADALPYSVHPLPIDGGPKRTTDTHDTNTEFVLDVRSYGKYYPQQQRFDVTQPVEYLWAVQRGVLNSLWLRNRPETFRDVSIIPASVYADLIGECVSKRFALDDLEKLTIKIVAAFYYYCQFHRDTTFDEYEHLKALAFVERAVVTPSKKVTDILGDQDPIGNVVELCNVIRRATKSIALERFDIGLLFAVTSSSWFGGSSRDRDIVSVGLEHPPTWLMIVWAAMFEATYRRSAITKICDRYNRKDLGSNFNKSMIALLGGIGKVEQIFLPKD